MRKICLIYNYAHHYRSSIFKLLDTNLPIDFVFGDKYHDVKKMNYSELKNFKKEVVNSVFLFKPFLFQKEVLPLIREEYSSYIMLGELYNISTWLMLFLSKIYNKKIYLWSHGWYGRESFVKAILKRIFFGLATGTFVYGEYARNLMVKNGLNSDKLFVIHNSLDYNKQVLVRKKLKATHIYKNYFKNDYPTIIYVGRLINSKKLDLLLKSVVLLNERNIHINVVIVGEGEVKEELINLTKELGLSNVWFYNACYDENELGELFFNADICVSPGNVGLTAVHSLTYGTPVITHDNFPFQGPEFETIIEGKTGAFFKFNNVNSLAETIHDWLLTHNSKNEVSNSCYRIIEKEWTPNFQLNVIRKHLKY